MSELGLSGILSRIADLGELEKAAFTPMPGGEMAPPPGGAIDPATGLPIDPATGMPMDPNAPMNPGMMEAAGGMPPAEMMAAQGMPVDPAMAAAGGAPVDPMAGAPVGDPAAAALPPEITAAIEQAVSASGGGNGGSKAGGGKAKADERLANIESMLNRVIGVLVGRGELPQEALDLAGSAEDGEVPAEVAPTAAGADPAAMGGPVSEAPALKLAADSSPTSVNETLAEVGSAARQMADLLGRFQQ